jgi:parvulin-like peptidyl-prolyl isomerase
MLAGTAEPVDAAPPISGVEETSDREVANSILARVNGEVIMTEEVMGPIRPRLEEAKAKLPARQFAEIRTQLLQQQLQNLIEQRLLLQEAKSVLPEPAIKMLEGRADGEFQQKMEKEMVRMGVSTEAELHRKLSESGQSLDQMRQDNRDLSIAREYLRMHLGPRLAVGRGELIDYYEAHRQEFEQTGGVRWSEILVTSQKHGSEEAAEAKARELYRKLLAGADFEALARSESEGATAFQGGKWDLTAQGSYIVAEVDEALFTLPPGKLSEPIRAARGWYLVRVDERVEGGVRSFEEVQTEVQKAVREERFRYESDRFMKQLVGKARVTTVFDPPAVSEDPT